MDGLQTLDYVEFIRAGSYGRGTFQCTACGHTTTLNRELPRCPTCGEGLWERAQWSPFSAERTALRMRLTT